MREIIIDQVKYMYFIEISYESNNNGRKYLKLLLLFPFLS